jgi:hypothetical protein
MNGQLNIVEQAFKSFQNEKNYQNKLTLKRIAIFLK